MFSYGEPVRIECMKQAKRIRAIVADLDNTLVNQFGDISRNNAAILRQMNEEGVIVGLATGRKANESSKLLDFWRLGHAVSFIVGSNGCDYINLRTRRHIQENYLTEKDLRLFSEEFKRETAGWGVRHHDCFYCNKMTFWIELYCLMHHLKPVVDAFDALTGDEFSRILIIASPSTNKKIFLKWNLKHFKAMPMGKMVIEVVKPQVSKYEGLKYALEDFELEPAEVMTFGDDYNDIELIRRTEGIAMKNAVEPLVEVARGKTKYSGAQDGVAYHLNALLIGDEYIFGDEQEEEEPVLVAEKEEIIEEVPYDDDFLI